MRVEEIIEEMFMVLPADTAKHISAKLKTERGQDISHHIVQCALAELRKNAEKYGWTVPHVKRGHASADDANRFYAVLLEKGGKYEFDYDESGVHLRNGTKSTAKLIATQSANQARALRAASEYVTSPVEIRMIERLASCLRETEAQAKILLDVLAA